MLGFYQLEIFIPSALSLKEKRFVLKSIKDRIRKKYNVSIAELDGNDKWQKSLLGIAMVSNDRRLIEGSFNQILNMMDQDGRIEVIDRVIEYY
jgi:uncharacterized protein YlxP (DUF503 family)